MSDKILIIGGSGFIGTALTGALLRAGHDVTLLNRGHKAMPGCIQLIADRNVAADMERIGTAAGDYDTIIDTSCYTSAQARLAWQSLAARTGHWIHISSAAVYQERDVVAGYAETDATGGAKIWGSYGADKSDIDRFLTGEAEDTPVTILRPPYVYGPGNTIDRETFVWGRALMGHPILLPGAGNARVQFVHVDDLASAILHCMHHVPERCAIYNVASDEIVSLREWTELLIDICDGDRGSIYTVGDRAPEYNSRLYFPYRDYACCLNTEHIWTDIGWRASYTLTRGFTQTYLSYTKEQLKRYGAHISQAEIEITVLCKNN